MKVEVPTCENLLHTWSLLEPGVTRKYDWEKESFEIQRNSRPNCHLSK
jgi:hypothetical protein